MSSSSPLRYWASQIAETIIDSVNARLPEKERVTVDAVRKDIRLLLGKPKIAETILDSINARLPEKEHLTLETFAKRLQSLLDEPQSSKK